MEEPSDDDESSSVVPFTYSVLEEHPEHVKALGMVSIEIGRLEMSLAEMLAALLHIDRRFGHTVYLTPHSNIGRITIVENVMREALKEGSAAYKAIQDLLTRSKAVMSKRHEYVHDVWGLLDSDQSKVIRRSVPFKRHLPEKVVPLAEIADLIGKIRVLVNEIRLETAQMFQSWPPYTWQGKPREAPEGETIHSEHPPEDDPPAPQDPPRSSRA